MTAFSEAGLKAIGDTLQGHVARGDTPGLVGLVERNGARHAWPLGRMTMAPDAAPVGRDAIFRIASMTKPLTAVAAMMLVEEGKLKVDETVERLAPELADRRVLRRMDGPLDDTVPANRQITVEDVLTFRLGWGIDFAETPFTRAAAEIPGFGMPNPAAPYTSDSFMAALGKLPLMAQPGERWLYTLGANVLGVLVERASGQSLPAFFQERICGPLGMKDTDFHVPPERAARLVTGYMPDQGKLVPFEPWNGLYGKPPGFAAGDSGLVSTADDYASFARFLHTGQTAGGRRLLSDATLRAMRTDRLTPEQRKAGADILGPSRSWGYMGVYAQASPEGVPAGAYGWDGGFGTSWFNDPASGLSAILLTQRVFDGPDPPQVHKDFWKAAMASLA